MSGVGSTLAPSTAAATAAVPATTQNSNDPNNLEKEEKDFFNQSINNGVTDKGKLTKDSILALYGMNSYAPPPQQPVAPTVYGAFMPQAVVPGFPQTNPQAFANPLAPMATAGPSQPQPDQFFNFGGNQAMFNRSPQQPPQPQQPQQPFLNYTPNNFANFGAQPQQPFGTFAVGNPYQQQFNTQKLNEDNIKKIESLNFNNFK